jgi:ABC-type bacteriocin/lantibiotic exporter with double-glycine peptidase domain
MSRRLAILVASFISLFWALPVAGTGELWIDVPFVKQEKNGCGAASIAMVMQYWFRQQERQTDGSIADAIEIQRVLYDPAANGIYGSAMEHYFQQHRFRTFSFRGEWSDIQQHIAKGRPLIVALEPPGADGPLHYVVVAGLDQDRGLVLLNDPAQRKLLKQDRSGFEKQWSGTDNWTLLALPQPAER